MTTFTNYFADDEEAALSNEGKQFADHDCLADTSGTNPVACALLSRMTDKPSPFAEYDLERAIALRWTLRDIKAKRLKLSPVSDPDLRALIDLGLVEMQDDAPVLTNAGHAALD
jgi:hypothetical protein